MQHSLKAKSMGSTARCLGFKSKLHPLPSCVSFGKLLHLSGLLFSVFWQMGILNLMPAHLPQGNNPAPGQVTTLPQGNSYPRVRIKCDTMYKLHAP